MGRKELSVEINGSLNANLYGIAESVKELANQKRIENRIEIVKLLHDSGQISDIKFKEMLEILWLNDPVPRYPA